MNLLTAVPTVKFFEHTREVRLPSQFNDKIMQPHLTLNVFFPLQAYLKRQPVFERTILIDLPAGSSAITLLALSSDTTDTVLRVSFILC